VSEGLTEPPHRLCCGQPHWGALCPDGLVMCCICFGRVPVGELHLDTDGLRVNMCEPCAREEARYA
jgi:hypothetical protein